MWQNGLLYGFVAREDVENAVRGQDPGTFLVRFSERNLGQFAIAYSDETRHAKHYLVDDKNDTVGRKRTLPEFIDDQPQFSYCLQLDLNPRTLIFRRCLKSSVFSPYRSAPKPEPKATAGQVGYSPLQ